MHITMWIEKIEKVILSEKSDFKVFWFVVAKVTKLHQYCTENKLNEWAPQH